MLMERTVLDPNLGPSRPSRLEPLRGHYHQVCQYQRREVRMGDSQACSLIVSAYRKGWLHWDLTQSAVRGLSMHGQDAHPQRLQGGRNSRD